jgi:hypothetical protein
MSRSIIPPSNDPDVVASAKALERAAKCALELGRKTGTPVFIMEKGNIIDLTKTPETRPKRGGKPKGKAG